MFEEIIQKALVVHDDLTHEEVEELCQDFYDTIPKKIKEETKIKRVHKYISKELELDSENDIFMKNTTLTNATKNFSLDTIPKYLFEGKAKISSNLINIQNLTKHIGNTHLFENANLKVNKTDKIALIGKNGCGKTTLLKMIIGKEGNESGSGTIELAPNLSIGYLSQDLFWKSESNTLKEEMLEVFPEVTEKLQRYEEIKDNPDCWEEANKLNLELLEMDGYRKNTIALEILKYFGFSDEQMEYNVLQLSGGEQTKVQIAKFLIMQVDLLILDEPTNHLDIEGIIFLETFCKNWKKAILSISHDIQFINNTCEKIAEISNKKIHNYPGNYEQYLEEKQKRFDKELKDYTNQQKEIARQQVYIDRFRYKATKAKGVQSRIKQLDKIERLEKPENESTVKNIEIQANKRLPQTIMKLEHLQVGYHFPLLTLPETLEVEKTDKIGIIGKNGSGKSTLLKTILGELSPLDGEAKISESLKIGSYSQVMNDLNMKNTIIKELLDSHTGDTSQNGETKIRKMLGGLLIQGDKVNQVISTLSGGERAKVALTKMLLTQPNIIVMDEPTNHLDIYAKEVIKQMLQGFNGTTLVVSHDRNFLKSISNKIWMIQDGILTVHRDIDKDFEHMFI
ncbi:ABC-F family ATP-binding cassette domain-containing protein [Candidatus Gracilibacteria bacterium]|nr:ABC-F family ATP-binding cassette domain-containing protein [Candidatus Gracilibacteria bacterium]